MKTTEHMVVSHVITPHCGDGLVHIVLLFRCRVSSNGRPTIIIYLCNQLHGVLATFPGYGGLFCFSSVLASALFGLQCLHSPPFD